MNLSFLFAGNRFHVLESMLDMGLNVTRILAMKGSYLEKVLNEKKIAFISIDRKSTLLEIIRETDFDIFLSNGLPYILPADILKLEKKKFINIHPSYLPDLRGADPVPGAILHRRDSGATCHYINEQIDAGDIISQVKISFNPDWDAILLYQLSFLAEKEAFTLAAQKGFTKEVTQSDSSNNIYYTFNPKDLIIDWNDPVDITIQRIKAFNTPSKCARFYYSNQEYMVNDAELLPLLQNSEYLEGQIVFVVNQNIGVVHSGKLLYLKGLQGDLSIIQKDQNLF